MNWTLIMIRGSVPALKLLAVGLAAAFAVAQFRRAMPIPLESSHVVILTGAASACVLALFYRRLFRWESGAAHPCERCGGPLGALLMGKRYYGRQLSDYRRCYNCGNANADI